MMRYLRSMVPFVLFFAGVVVPLTSFSQEMSVENTECIRAKESVITWANSLKSFSLSYDLSQSTYEHVGGNMREESSMAWQIVYRQDGENFYFSKETLSSKSVENDVEICSQYNGFFDTFTSFSGSSLGVVNDMKRKGLPFSWGIYLTPQEIFGHRGDYSLSDVLSEGSTQLIEQDGKRILSHINSNLSAAVDVTLDTDYGVKLIEWCRRPDSLSEETLKTNWKGDIFYLRILTVTLELSQYRAYNDVFFPSKVVKTWWRMDETVAEEVNTSFEKGKISKEELTVLLYSVPVQPVCVQTFVLKEAEINIPLSKEDIAIEWPKGVRIIQAKDMPEPGGLIPPERKIWPYIASVATCIIIIFVVSWIIIYRRKKI